jgi:phosphatidylglycerophosphatase A
MPAASTISRRPDARFLLAHPAHFIALGFGAGLAPRAPGTVGTVVGLLLCWVLQPFLSPVAITLLAVALFMAGVWACDVTGRALGVVDSGAMVWDEVVAFLPLAAFAETLWMQAIAFGLFRLFDIWKPFPIRQLERRIPGGLGVMADDVLAAGYALALVILMQRSFGPLP